MRAKTKGRANGITGCRGWDTGRRRELKETFSPQSIKANVETWTVKGPCSSKRLYTLVFFVLNRYFCQIQCFDCAECSLFSRLAEVWLYTYWRRRFTLNHFSWVQGAQSHLGWTWAFKLHELLTTPEGDSVITIDSSPVPSTKRP